MNETSYESHARDFTESSYREILRIAARRYSFIPFTEPNPQPYSVLWRHDIDISPQRARALARIEREEGVTATYFVLFHSDMYNALEAESVRIFGEIAELGHSIGLHFDPSFYAGRTDFESALRLEKNLLEETLGVAIDAFSWHNPSAGNWIETLDATTMAGMVNAYSAHLRETFAYVSDSHGIWRFRRLHDVLESGHEPFLHVLTHPEWWVPEPLAPRARVERAVHGRATRVLATYDAGLAAAERPNVR